MVALDVGGSGAPAGLHDVRIEGALHQEFYRVPCFVGAACDVSRGLLEDPDELTPDDLAFGLGVSDVLERIQEALLRVDHDEVHAGGSDEVFFDLLGFTLAQQAVIDEHAGQLLAHGGVDQRCRHRGVDASGQATDQPGIPDLVLDLGHQLGGHVRAGPVGFQPGTLAQKVLDHPLAKGRVHHLGMPLHAIQPAFVVLEGSDRGTRALRGDAGSGGRLRDRVTVRHPDRLGRRLTTEKGACRVSDAGAGVAVLAHPCLGDLSAEGGRHGLEAVADTQHGHPGLDQFSVQRRCTVSVHRRRSTGEQNGRRLLGQHLRGRHGVRHDLAVSTGLAHPAGDQLGVLGAEVNDEDGMLDERIRLRLGRFVGAGHGHPDRVPAAPARAPSCALAARVTLCST